MDALLHDPTFWVAVSFVIFVVLVYKPMSKAIVGALDDRAEKIRSDLDEAARLRDEAQTLLASYKRKQRDAEQEAEQIVNHARTEAARLRDQTRENLEATLARREQQALDRIAQAEAQAVAEVRGMAVDLAIAATRRLLADRVSGERASQLIDDSIRQIDAKLH